MCVPTRLGSGGVLFYYKRVWCTKTQAGSFDRRTLSNRMIMQAGCMHLATAETCANALRAGRLSSLEDVTGTGASQSPSQVWCSGLTCRLGMYFICVRAQRAGVRAAASSVGVGEAAGQFRCNVLSRLTSTTRETWPRPPHPSSPHR